MRFFIHSAILLLIVSAASGQNSQDQFGKSRIQYKTFRWQHISTINFDIYYSEGGKELAANAARYAESDFARITELLGFSPYSKIKLIMYNSVADLRQSNINLEDPNYMAGGQTNFVKSKLEIVFEGSQMQMKKDISFGIAHLLINTMMYGGSLREIVQSSYLLSLPEWYINGASAYIAEGWSMEMDNFMRDACLNRHLHKPESFTGAQATLAGQSVWNYIVQKYGMQSMTSVLHLTQTFRNEESGIESAFGISYHLFTKEWKEYYAGMARQTLLSYKMPGKELKFGRSFNKEYHFQNLSFSPDGKFLSFSRNYKGKYSVVLQDLEKGKSRKIFKGGYKVVNQKVDFNTPLTDWQSASVFSVLNQRRDKTFLRIYDLSAKTRTKIQLKNVKQVFGYDLSEDGKSLVLSAGEKGQSDIFIYDLSSNSVKKITDDLYDDLDPKFAGASGIVFCSNRREGIAEAEFSYKDLSPQYQLFSMDVSGRNLKKITHYGINTQPEVTDHTHIAYISTEYGISTLFNADLQTQRKTQVSSYALDIMDYAINEGKKQLAFTMYYKGKERIFYNPVAGEESVLGTTLTIRQQKFMEANPNLMRDPGQDIPEDTLNSEEIDINNYHFESDIRKQQQNKSANPDKNKTVQKDDINVKGPYSYKNLFSADRLISTLMIDPLKGIGVLGEVSMSDMFGNHRMTAGVFGLVDLKSSNLYAEYQYLKKRVDVKSRFDRETFYATNASVAQRYTL
ncbi:MAG: hypothetical protein ACJ75J_02560, partial [Cytophagaceae bacterium]